MKRYQQAGQSNLLPTLNYECNFPYEGPTLPDSENAFVMPVALPYPPPHTTNENNKVPYNTDGDISVMNIGALTSRKRLFLSRASATCPIEFGTNTFGNSQGTEETRGNLSERAFDGGGSGVKEGRLSMHSI